MNANKDKCHFPSSLDQSEKFSLLISIIKNSGFLHHFGVIIERKLNFNEHVTSLCYCKAFSLVPDFTGCTKTFVTEKCSTLLCHLKSNNIIGQRKTTNKEKHIYP